MKKTVTVLAVLLSIAGIAAAAYSAVQTSEQDASYEAALPFATQENMQPCGYCNPEVGQISSAYTDDWCGTGAPAQVSTMIVIHRGTCHWMVVQPEGESPLECKQRFACSVTITRVFTGLAPHTPFEGWVSDENGDRPIQPTPTVPSSGVDIRYYNLACGSALFTWSTKVVCPDGSGQLVSSISGRCKSCQ